MSAHADRLSVVDRRIVGSVAFLCLHRFQPRAVSIKWMHFTDKGFSSVNKKTRIYTRFYAGLKMVPGEGLEPS